jgi:hypothetical protein
VFGRQTTEVMELEEDVQMQGEAPEVEKAEENQDSNENGGLQPAISEEILDAPMTNPVSNFPQIGCRVCGSSDHAYLLVVR